MRAGGNRRQTNVLPGQDQGHTGLSNCQVDIDSSDRPVGDWTAIEVGVEIVRLDQIRHKPARPGDQAMIFQAASQWRRG
jgi:hypothetical protein